MKNQFGNALWFILIAIALLGLLTMTFSRSSKNNDTGSFEQNQIAATEILRYAKSLENAVQSLLARGCSENEISFENNVVAGYTNSRSPVDKSCHVFDSNGAGMTYEAPDEKWLDSSKSGDAAFANYTITGSQYVEGIETSRNDLVVILPLIDQNYCSSINRQLKISGFTGDFPEDSNGMDIGITKYFSGQFVAQSTNIADTIESNTFQTRLSACIYESSGCTGGSCYNFYHVLHAR